MGSGDVYKRQTLEHVFADDENVANLVDPKYFELPEDEDEESE